MMNQKTKKDIHALLKRLSCAKNVIPESVFGIILLMDITLHLLFPYTGAIQLIMHGTRVIRVEGWYSMTRDDLLKRRRKLVNHAIFISTSC